MAAGLGVIKEAGTDLFAERFHDDGYSVLAFDYRRLGESGGAPRQQQTVAARSAMRVGFYRPGRFAARIRCPLLVVAYDDDGVAPPGPAIRAAHRAPRGQVVRLPGGHYAAFLDAEEQTARALLSFLDREVAASSARA
jgi:alpha/beta superfamily hydrolase